MSPRFLRTMGRSFRVALSAFPTYVKESVFFARRRREESIELSIRRRAHQLDKLVRLGDRYPEALKRTVAGELEAFLENIPRGTPSVQWAREILRAWRSGGGPSSHRHEDAKNADERTIPEIFRRRTHRRFKSVPPTLEEKRRLVAAALAAPSSCNRQPLSFLFVESESTKRTVARSVPGGRAFFEKAPCLVVVTCDAADYAFPKNRFQPWLDTGAGVMCLLLAAERMGLAACWGDYGSFGGAFHEEGGIRERDVRSALAVPDHHLLTACIAIGQPDGLPAPVPRVDAESRLFLERMTGGHQTGRQRTRRR